MGAMNGKDSRRQGTEPWGWKQEVKVQKEVEENKEMRSFSGSAACEIAAKMP